TIQGQEFKHMFCHCVLTYSNWEWGGICFSESYEAIKLGVQSSLLKLGRVPERHRTDGTTAATHSIGKGKKGKRDFNENYINLMDHFGMKAEMINDPNHNADVESSHNVLKNRINQYLEFRISRDFDSRKEYEGFIFKILEKANTLRSKRLKEELSVMKELPVNHLSLYTESNEKVRLSSTISVKRNVYSVPSRLIGETVT
ncbi:transposase, partial [Candidatus Magnetomorum sp. HK-1]